MNTDIVTAWSAAEQIGTALTQIERLVTNGEGTRLDVLDATSHARGALGRIALTLSDLHGEQTAGRPPAYMTPGTPAPRPASSHITLEDRT